MNSIIYNVCFVLNGIPHFLKTAILVILYSILAIYIVSFYCFAQHENAVKTNFVQRVVQGKHSVNDFHKSLEIWHSERINCSLKEQLGLTDTEYQLWIESNGILFQDIVYCRKNNLDIRTYLKDKK